MGLEVLEVGWKGNGKGMGDLLVDGGREGLGYLDRQSMYLAGWLALTQAGTRLVGPGVTRLFTVVLFGVS